MINPNLSTKLDEWCPSRPVIDLRTGERTGWWYEIHIRPDGDKRTECQFCGLKFSQPTDIGGD